jgi:hypothetical protein
MLTWVWETIPITPLDVVEGQYYAVTVYGAEPVDGEGEGQLVGTIQVEIFSTTTDDAHSIETLDAKYITKHSAVIGGTYTTTDATHVAAGLLWRPKGSGAWSYLWWAQSPYYIESTTTFWFSLQGLLQNLTYEFKAFYKIGSSYTYGATKEFRTLPYDVIWQEPGWEYKTCKQAIEEVEKISLGRHYADAEGNLKYESRLARAA